MLERESTLFRFVLHYAKLLVADLSESQMIKQPVEGMNHPAWILGHLIVSADIAAVLLGEDQSCSKGFLKVYGPGSKPTNNLLDYMGKAVYLDSLEDLHGKVLEAAKKVSKEYLAHPQNVILVEWLPTIGDLAAHLMTTHPSTHLGQLSAWRKMLGLPSVLKI